MRYLNALFISGFFTLCFALDAIFPLSKGTSFDFYDEKTQLMLFSDSIVTDTLLELPKSPKAAWQVIRKLGFIQDVFYYEQPRMDELKKWGIESQRTAQNDVVYKIQAFNMKSSGFIIYDTVKNIFTYPSAKHLDSNIVQIKHLPSIKNGDSSWAMETDWHNSPKYKHTVVPGLGIVKVEYFTGLEGCDFDCVRPYTQDTSLLSYKMNPEYHNYYLRRIVKANGDTLFDAVRDVVSPVLPNNSSDKIKGMQKGQWPIPSGFEVKSVERILANGSSEILNYNVQNRVLYLEQVKNRNAVEWVRIVPKSGAVRTLRWE